MKEIDKDEVVFLVAAVTIDGIIWSDDGHFKEQELVQTYTTSESINIIE